MKNRIWANLRNRFQGNSSPRITPLTRLACLTFFGLLVLPLEGLLQKHSFSPGETSLGAAEPPTTPQLQGSSDTNVESSSDLDTDADESLAAADEQSLSTAPVKKVSTEIEVPADLRPTPATAETLN